MESDFELRIEFDPTSASATNVLSALTSVTASFEHLDAYISGTLNGPLALTLTIDRVEQGSIRLFLKNALSSTNDDAIRDKGLSAIWREALVEFKWLALKFLSEEGYSKRDLLADAEKVAAPLSARLVDGLPDDFVPNFGTQVRRLATTARQIEGTAKLIAVRDGGQLPIVPSVDFDQRAGEPDPSVAPDTEQVRSQWRLVIKKPDLIGRSQWEFRLGRRPIFAAVRDRQWLSRFHAGEIVLRPGDMLDCVAESTIFKENGVTIDEKHEIIQVISIKHTSPDSIQDMLIE
ncbi:hypothetical protein [Maricaulis salignorans]|uniref:Uncharacterized protein n=1 Tax=Maricaulis salignorans TaxID=144026 RepID=A0A1G9RFF1_9PROT|nr:hypothetical protein [Maricaulis salignorans]SDM21901.1 hypothetical protein SAMN04488568_1072 [Maricaulis salignorans]